MSHRLPHFMKAWFPHNRCRMIVFIGPGLTVYYALLRLELQLKVPESVGEVWRKLGIRKIELQFIFVVSFEFEVSQVQLKLFNFPSNFYMNLSGEVRWVTGCDWSQTDQSLFGSN